MSARVMNAVLKHGPTDHTDFSVLLALASHANDAGGDCWPSVKAIAAEMRLGERSVARSLSVLENDGWISVTRRSRNHKGSSYQVTISRLTSHATQAGEKARSHATVAGENAEVTCQIEQSHLPNTTKSPAKRAFPLIGNVLKRHETNKEPAPSEPCVAVSSSQTNAKTTKSAFVIPEWVDPQMWSDFVEMRKFTKHPMTQRAMTITVGDLSRLKADGFDPNACLAQAVKNSWRGVYPTDKPAGKGESRGSPAKSSGAQQAADEYLKLKDSPKVAVLNPGRVVANG